LLQTKRDSFSFCVNGQNRRFNFITFSESSNGGFTRLVPGNIRQVYQSIDVAVEANKDTEVSDRLDVTFKVITLIVKYCKLFPWVALT